MNDLTPKQEKFIQNIVSGMSQRQAYKEAFDADYDNDAIDSNASTLFNSTKIQQRYKELLEELKDVAIMSAIERMKFLTDVVKENEQEDLILNGVPVGKKVADLNTKLKAVDILNKMSGEYTTKLEHTGSIPVVIDDDIRD